jgi:hypothetical protein
MTRIAVLSLLLLLAFLATRRREEHFRKLNPATGSIPYRDTWAEPDGALFV